MEPTARIEELAERFESCSKVLTAIGDETRQHLLLEMMRMGKCTGARVTEIAERTNLSRPAVSHHMQILKDAGIVRVRKEGTMTFYYFDRELKPLDDLVSALQLAKEVAGSLHDPEDTRSERGG